jgi:hypothetical protein
MLYNTKQMSVFFRTLEFQQFTMRHVQLVNMQHSSKQFTLALALVHYIPLSVTTFHQCPYYK